METRADGHVPVAVRTGPPGARPSANRHVAVTEHPTAAWTAQHLRNVFSENDAPRYLLHDRAPRHNCRPTSLSTARRTIRVVHSFSMLRRRFPRCLCEASAFVHQELTRSCEVSNPAPLISTSTFRQRQPVERVRLEATAQERGSRGRPSRRAAPRLIRDACRELRQRLLR